MTRARKVLVAVVAAAATVVVAAGAWLYHDGYRAYVLRTGSMAPTYPPGSLVIDRPGIGGLRVGDVITFDKRELGEKVVTHRVVAIAPNGAISTKGDANRTPDVWTIAPGQVRGTVTFGVKRLGFLLVFLRQPSGIASLVLAMIGLVLLWGLFFPAAGEPLPAPRRAAATT